MDDHGRCVDRVTARHLGGKMDNDWYNGTWIEYRTNADTNTNTNTDTDTDTDTDTNTITNTNTDTNTNSEQIQILIQKQIKFTHLKSSYLKLGFIFIVEFGKHVMPRFTNPG